MKKVTEEILKLHSSSINSGGDGAFQYRNVLRKYIWQTVANRCRIGCRASSRIILTGILGALILLNYNSLNDASAYSQYNWFRLVDETGHGTIIVKGNDSYDSHRIRYNIHTTAKLLGDVTFHTEYSVSERTNNGNWTEPVVFWYHELQKTNVGEPINEEAIVLSPGQNNHGIWYGTGYTGAVRDGGHENASHFTFVPNAININRIAVGSSVDVKLRVRNRLNSAFVHDREHIIRFENNLEAEWNSGVETNDEGHVVLKLDTGITLTDIGGTMGARFNQILSGGSATSINKWRFSLFEDESSETVDDVPPVDEAILNNPNRKWDTDIVEYGVEEVTELEGTETKVGDGTSYGAWYIGENDGYEGLNYLAHTSLRQFLFRPNRNVIGKLEKGSSVRSYLRIQKGWCNVMNFPSNKDCSLHTSRFDGEIDSALVIAVTITNNKNPTISISGSPLPVTAEDGVAATFTVTSDQASTSAIEVNYTATATSNFLDPDQSSESGDNTTISGNRMMDFTDRSEAQDGTGPFTYVLTVPLRDSGVTDSGRHSVTVTLNSDTVGSDYAVSETESSALVRVNIEEKSSNLLGFEEESRNVEVLEGESVTLTVVLNTPLNNDITIPFTIATDTPESATPGTDYTPPTTNSVTIAAGRTKSSVTISTIQDSDIESDEEIVISLTRGSNFNFSAVSAKRAIVWLIDDDKPEPPVAISGKRCDDVVAPAGVTTINTVGYWETTPGNRPEPRVYFAAQENFDIRVGFRTPVKVATSVLFAYYLRDGSPVDTESFTSSSVGETGVNHTIQSSGSHRGLMRYRILPRDTADNQWYGIDPPCEFHVVWTDASRPGITLTANLEQVREGQGFTLTATATPAPTRDITIPISFSDETRLDNPDDFEITINKGMTTGSKAFQITRESGDQTNDALTATVQYRSSYYLDEPENYSTVPEKTANSVSLTIVDTDKYPVKFKEGSRDIEVGESGNAVLKIELLAASSLPITVKYQLTGVEEMGNTAHKWADFTEPPAPLEVRFPSRTVERSISIPIVSDSLYEESETFTVRLIESSDAFPDIHSTAKVTIISDDKPESPVTISGKQCNDVVSPTGVTTINTVAYWETIPGNRPEPRVYFATHENFDIRVGFRTPIKVATSVLFAYYLRDGSPVDTESFTSSSEGETGVNHTIQSSGSHRGLMRYRILPRDTADNQWYGIGPPCEFHVVWTDANRPGITLTANREQVMEGQGFTVTATATPAPSSDITVPISFSDQSRLDNPDDFEITIKKGMAAGSKTFKIAFASGDQQNDALTVTASYRSSYHLDEPENYSTAPEKTANSVNLTIVDSEKHPVRFKEGSRDIEVGESGNAVLKVELLAVSLMPITVKYQLIGDEEMGNTATKGVDFSVPPTPLEVRFPSRTVERSISIPIVPDSRYEVSETFTVRLIESDDVLPVNHSTAKVTIVSDDAPIPTSPFSLACGDVLKPQEVGVPNTQAYWKSTPATLSEPKVYIATDESFDVKIGFRDPETEAESTPDNDTDFLIGAYALDGTAHSESVRIRGTSNQNELNHTISQPGKLGYSSYRILPRDPRPPSSWYSVGDPCEFHVWWTSAVRPGISLSIDEDTVSENGTLTLRATATPALATNKNISVPITFTNSSLVQNSDNLSIEIAGGNSSGTLTLNAGEVPSGQASAIIKATAAWSGNYFLDQDDAVRSASVNLTTARFLSFSMDSYSVTEPAEGETVNATITVNISQPLDSGNSVEVYYETMEIADANTQSDEDPAKSGVDFTGTELTTESEKITFNAGDSMKTISIPILADTNNERDEVFKVKLLKPGLVNGESIATLEEDENEVATLVTIIDDLSDVDPELVLKNATIDESVGIYNLPVRLTGTTIESVTIDFELLTTGNATRGTDATNGDFMLPDGIDSGSVVIDVGTNAQSDGIVSGSLVIDAGTNESILPITIFDDTLPESSETIILKFDNPTNAVLPDGSATKEITITIDQSDRVPTIRVDTSPVQEGGVNQMITVNLAPPATTDDISIDYVVSAGANGTATEGTDGDFIRTAGTLMFDNDDSTPNISSTTATIPLNIIDDSNFEQAETIEVSLTNLQGTNVRLAGAQTSMTTTITINEDEDEQKPAISVANTIEVGEDVSRGTITIPITLTSTTHETVTIEVYTSSTGFTALAGSDYIAHNNTIVAIPAGNLRYDIELHNTIIDNQTYDGDKTFKVSLWNAINTRNTLTTTPLETIVTIRDNESVPTLDFADGTGIVTDEDVGNFVVRVVSSKIISSTENVTLNYSIPTGGTAEPGTDFIIPTRTSFEIKAGEKVGEIEIPILTDTDTGEGDETFKIVLEKPQALSSSPDLRLKNDADELELEVTIKDIDGSTPTLSFELNANNKISVNDNISGGTLTVTVLLSAATDVTVNYRTEDVQDSAVAGTDYTATSGTIEFRNGSTRNTFNVKIGDISGESTKIFRVIIDTANTGVRLRGGGNTTVTDGNGIQRNALSREVIIVNVGAPLPTTLTVYNPNGTDSVSEGSTLTYLFTLSNTIGKPVSITYSISSESTAKSNDYELSPITFKGLTASFTIRSESDKVYEGEEKIELTLTSTNAEFSAGVNTYPLTVTIVDDEALPVLSIKDTAQTVYEGTSATIRVKSSVETERPVSVGFIITDLSGSFLNTTDSDSSPIDMTFKLEGSEYIGELIIAINTDSNTRQTTGEIILLLTQPTDGYLVDDKTKNAIIKVVDESIHIISLSASSSSVTEGDVIEIELKSNQFPQYDFNVNLMIAQNGDYLFAPVEKKVRFIRNRKTSSLRLSTVSNPNTSSSGTVTVEVVDGVDYVAGNSVSVRVNKAAGNSAQTPIYSVASSVIKEILSKIQSTPSGSSANIKPTLSIGTVNGTVEEGESAEFEISATHAFTQYITVNISLSQTGDFIIGSVDRTVDLKAGLSKANLIVATQDDKLAESDGRITATMKEGKEYIVGTERASHVFVSDSLDRQHRENQITGILHTVFPDLLAHSSTRMLDISKERVTQAFSSSPTTSIELNGRSPTMIALKSGGEMLNGKRTDWRSIVDGSSFTVALYPEGGEISPATVWGLGDQRSFSSDGIGEQQSWDGESITGHFGFDVQVNQGILTGLAMSVSQSEIEYGWKSDSKMSFDTRTTGVHPYLGFSTADGHSRMQFMAGYGENELKLSQDNYSKEILTGRYHTVGYGGNNRVHSIDSFGGLQNLELGVASEAWHSQQLVDSVRGVVDNLQMSARHVRIAIEGTHQHYFETNGRVNPSISIGLRGDGRNKQSVFGLDAGSEVKFGAFDGLEVLGSGNTMLTALNRIHRWEIKNSLNYDSEYDGKGLLLNVSSSWSGADENTNWYIWGSELANNSYVSTGSIDGDSIELEIGYGYEILDGSALMTPYFEYNQTDINGNEFQVGSRLKTNTGIDFELETVNNTLKTGTINQEYNLTGRISW